jgi:hypothetical protein
MAGFEAACSATRRSRPRSVRSSRFAIVDIGRALRLLHPRHGRDGAGQGSACRSEDRRRVRAQPVIPGHLAGIGGSVVGLGDLDGHPLALHLTTIGLLAGLTTPLIAIVLGYSRSLRAGRPRPQPHAGRAPAHLDCKGARLTSSSEAWASDACSAQPS